MQATFMRSALSLLMILLASRLYVTNGGAGAYTLFEGLVEEMDEGGAIVEVGSDRGEGSTQFFSRIANSTGRVFYSVDFSNEGFRRAMNVCGSCAHQGMGEKWLQSTYPFLGAGGGERKGKGEAERRGGGEEGRGEAGRAVHQIVAAYLDNYDWTWRWTVGMQYKQQQRADYSAEGLTLDNEASQAAHLAQSILVAGHCSDRCFVLFDDTWPSPRPGVYSGKGGTAVPFLLANNFEIIDQSPVDGPSFEGYVLLRKYKSPDRASQETGGWSFPRAPQPQGRPDDCKVVLTLRDFKEGSEMAAVDASVWGAIDSEHTLVFYLNNAEVGRYVDWGDAQGRGGTSPRCPSADAAHDNEIPACSARAVFKRQQLEDAVISAELVDSAQRVVAVARLEGGRVSTTASGREL